MTDLPRKDDGAAEEGRKPAEENNSSIFSRLRTGFTVAIALALGAVVTASVIIPALAGWVPLTVLSGSMEPTYPVGSQVFVDPVEGKDRSAIPTGTIISYMPYPDDPTLVTHRIVDMKVDSTGVTHYTMQGDNNSAPDPLPVADYQVRAIAKYHLPYMGYVSKILTGKQKSIGLTIVIGVLFAYVLYQIAMVALEKTGDRKNGGAPDATESPTPGDSRSDSDVEVKDD